MSDEKKYNGWVNYETWLVNLWFDNDQGTYEMIQEFAIEEARSIIEISDYLKNMVEEESPTLDNGLYCDLMTAAISEVDFYEIAEQHWNDTKEERTEYRKENELEAMEDIEEAEGEEFTKAVYTRRENNNENFREIY